MIDAKRAKELSGATFSEDEEMQKIELLIIEAANKWETSIEFRRPLYEANRRKLKDLGYKIVTRYKGQDGVAEYLDTTISW